MAKKPEFRREQKCFHYQASSGYELAMRNH